MAFDFDFGPKSNRFLLYEQYNDAEFSDNDFINLARMAQANKLQRHTTTGRFGLGFNSLYHFTDLPSSQREWILLVF